MGERLVIDVQDEHGEHIATAYYHWGGYTVNALFTLQRFNDANHPDLQYINHDRRYRPPTVLEDVIYRLAATGAGLLPKINVEDEDGDEQEIDNPIFDNYNAPLCRNRNDGVIDVNEKGIRDSLIWADHLIKVTIDANHNITYDIADIFEPKTIDNDCTIVDIYWYNLHKLTSDQLSRLLIVLNALIDVDGSCSYSLSFDDGSTVVFVE